jgi:phosphohistidine phosphatase SixA
MRTPEIMLKTVVPALVFSLGVATSALAQSTVIFVRHAERADSTPGKSPTMASDPDLSDAGRARAAALAEVLKDAGITAIYVTEYKRTQQTAAPLAAAIRVTPIVIKADDATGLAAAIKATKGNALVIGHSNTVPAAIKALGVPTDVKIGDDDYDSLFVASTGSAATLVRLHYR